MTTNDANNSNHDVYSTTAVSLWFGKAQSKNNRRYSVVAGWSYKESTKELHYILWRDQGPAPYLSTLSAWIVGLQPGVVLVSCAGGHEALKEDRNLNMWMEDVEEDLQQFQAKDDTVESDEDENTNDQKPPENLTRVVRAVVPPQVNKDGVEILRTLVQKNPAALYQLQANPELTTTGNIVATPLICAAAVLLQALGLYQATSGAPISGPSLCSTLRESENNDREFSIKPMPTTNFLVLDRAASTSLSVWPISHAGQASLEGATSWHTSLYGLLAHYARTQMGKTQIQQWLLHPLIELEPLLERQEAVAYLVDNGIFRQSLVDQGLQLMAGTNLERLATQLESFEQVDTASDDSEENPKRKKGFTGSTRKSLQVLYELYVLASLKIPSLAQQLAPILEENGKEEMLSESSSTSPLLKKFANELKTAETEIARAAELCETVLDLDMAPREFVVKPTHVPELADLAQELAQWQADLEECHSEMNQAWIDCTGLPSGNNNKYVRLHVPDSKSNGEMSYDFQFRLPNRNDAKTLQNDKALKGKVTVHRLLKNGVYFSTSTLKALASQKANLDREYDRHQRHVVAHAMAVAASYAPIVDKVRRSVAFLDGIAAMAQLAVFCPAGYCRPILSDSDDDGVGICLKQARHPCVEKQENVDFIPNDIELTMGTKSCWLVTGPNMGGKSTFIRSVGAIVALAQIGSYVPCQLANINIVHSIAARTGASDLQDRGISTFMSEMLESSAILQTATRRSLIIVDELGRGTSTFDGYGLARSICEYVVENIKCLTVFATHFHELTSTLPAQFPKGEIHNCHVSASTSGNEVIFLYKIEDGPCLESFGIQVAEMALVPPQVIVDAKAKLVSLEATASTNKRKRTDDENDDDKNWLAKFEELNVPEMDDKMLRQVLLQTICQTQ